MGGVNFKYSVHGGAEVAALEQRYRYERVTWKVQQIVAAPPGLFAVWVFDLESEPALDFEPIVVLAIFDKGTRSDADDPVYCSRDVVPLCWAEDERGFVELPDNNNILISAPGIPLPVIFGALHQRHKIQESDWKLAMGGYDISHDALVRAFAESQ